MEANNIQSNSEDNKPKQQINTIEHKKDEDTKQVFIEEQKNEDPKVENVIKSGETFESHYQMNLVRGSSTSGPLFKINLPDTKFSKYLIKLENGTVMPGAELDMDKIRDDHFYLGSMFGISTNQAHEAMGFSIPGVFNAWPSYIGNSHVGIERNVDVTWKGVGKQPSDFWKFITCAENACVYYISDLLADDLDWDDADEAIYGGGFGMQFNNDHMDGYCLNIGTKPLRKSDLSYVTESGDDILNLAADKMRSRSYNEPFRWAEYREFTQDLKRFVVYLHNTKVQSPLCYSPIVEQLKLMLYTEAAHCGYEFVEALNAHFFRKGRIIFDGSEGPTVVNNVCQHHDSGKQISLTWLSLTQFMEYQEHGLAPYNGDVDFTGLPWYFVPIKVNWLQGYDSRLIFPYLLGLLPYPLFVFEYPTEYGEITDYDAANQTITMQRKDMWIEPLASKVRIAGHTHICFVIVDWDDTKTCNPRDINNVYDVDLVTINVGAEAYEIPNLHFGKSAVNHVFDGDLRGLLASFVRNHYAEEDSASTLLNSYTQLTGWAIYSDLINLVGVLTTAIGCKYANGSAIKGGVPNLMLFCGIPFIESKSLQVHMEIPEPDFYQRSYALCGFVKQSMSDFIFMFDRRELCQTFAGVRYQCANLAYNEISVKGNEVPNYIISESDEGEFMWIEKRMRMYAQSILSEIQYNKLIWDNDSLTSFGGLIKYRRPYSPVDETFSSYGITNFTEINLYCNVGDWVSIFHDFIEAKTYRTTDLDEDKISGVSGIIEQVANNTHIYLGTWKEESYRKLLATVFNDTYGRTHMRDIDIIKFKNNGRNNVGQDITVRLWEPIWTMGILSWNADADSGAADTEFNWWPNIDVDIKLQDGALQFPLIRSLDYVYPSSSWEPEWITKLALQINSLYVKQVIPYIISRSKMGNTYKTKEDYRLWDALEAYKK